MKKIAFFVGDLDIGGIEKAIVGYVNSIDKKKYDVTLFLENAKGAYIDEVDPSVHLVNFGLSQKKNVLIRKIINAYKLLIFSIKYYHKFYFSANFKTTIKSGAILAKRFSKNNAYWFHGNYWHNEEDAKKFIKHFRINKYKKIVFVSNYSKKLYENICKDNKQELFVINNPINYQEVLLKSKEKINLTKPEILLLNVGRHSEEEKHLSMLINCIKRLKDDNFNVSLWLLGSGPDTERYQEQVRDLKLENRIKFLGFSKNVYPYIKMCDSVVLSSYTEGNPVVFLETKILNKPIITTDVSDARDEINGFGIVTKNNEDDYYLGLKEFLVKGYQITKKFNGKEYNEKVMKLFYEVVENGQS